MRILHVSGTFLPVKGGGPYFVHHLSQHLERAGHACRVVTTEACGSPEAEIVETDRAAAVTVGGAPLSPTFPLTLRRTLESFDPDIVHANYPLPLYPDVAALLARLQGRPLVLTCHGAFETSLESVVGVVGTVYNNTLLRGTLRLADRIHVSNGGILDAFGFYCQHESKASVIPIGVDTEWFDPEVVREPSPDWMADRTKTVLYVGAFRRYKGLQSLVTAFGRVVADRDAQLVLVGDGPKQGELERLVSDENIENSVRFVGHVSDEVLRQAYTHADVFVLPSPSIRESLGMVALEAMAMGVPTIVTAGSGIGRVLDDSDAGVVVAPNAPGALADAILTLLDDETAAGEQERAGRRLVQTRFAWTSLVDEYVQMYERL